jgi:hypothetical protein
MLHHLGQVCGDAVQLPGCRISGLEAADRTTDWHHRLPPAGIGLPIPGSGWTTHHDSIVSTLARDTRSAGIETDEEPRGIFVRALPQAALQRKTDRSGTRVGIVPDLCVQARFPAAPGALAARQGEARIERRYLFYIKTVHVGGDCYHPRYIAQPQRGCGGAVTERARRVPVAYRRAGQLWALTMYTTRTAQCQGQSLRCCQGIPRVVALLAFRPFRSYGEWSPEVHELLQATAIQTAQRQWRRMGARSLAEALGSITQRLRRRSGRWCPCGAMYGCGFPAAPPACGHKGVPCPGGGRHRRYPGMRVAGRPRRPRVCPRRLTGSLPGRPRSPRRGD